MDKDWVLSYSGVAYRFGPPSRAVRLVRFAFGPTTDHVDDRPVPRGDGTIYGQDSSEAGTISLDLLINMEMSADPYGDARVARAAFVKAWRADPVRRKFGAVAALQLGTGVLVYGRPRRVVMDDTDEQYGIIKIRAEFDPVDGMYYSGGAMRFAEASISPRESLGLQEMLIEPLTITGAEDAANTFEVLGTERVPVLLEIRGPILAGATVEVVGVFKVALNRALAYDQVVQLDARPWVQTVRLNGAAVNVLALSGAQIDQLFVPPGVHELVIRGKSAEGVAQAKISWRDATTGH